MIYFKDLFSVFLKCGTVKNDCPMLDLKIYYRLLVYITSLTVCLGDI